MSADLKVQTICKKRVKLDSEQSAFCEQCSPLLDQRQEMFWCFAARKYHGFSAQCSDFCPSDIENITVFCDHRKGDIRSLTHQTIAKSRSVEKQRNVIATAHLADGFQFCLCIQGTVLRRIGNINHPRKYHMFVAFVIPEGFQAVLQIFCFHFAFVLRNRNHFMTAVLDGSRLMAGYMAGLCCDHSFIRCQHGTDHNSICLRTARQEVDICLRTFTRFPDFLFCTFTVWIRSVSGYFLHVCFHKSLKDLLMCSFRIVVFK